MIGLATGPRYLPTAFVGASLADTRVGSEFLELTPAQAQQMSDEQYHQLVSALHGQWRTAARIVMILLSVHGWPPAQIAAFLHYHPGMVRRWIGRHDLQGLAGLPDRPRSGRPRIGGPRLGERIRALLAVPKAWTVPRIWRALGRPKMSLSTLYRRVREQARWRRPRLVGKGDPDRDQILTRIRAHIAALPTGSVVLAQDETHLDWLAKSGPAGCRGAPATR